MELDIYKQMVRQYENQAATKNTALKEAMEKALAINQLNDPENQQHPVSKKSRSIFDINRWF